MPAGAMIFVDGVAQGISPVSARVMSGDHSVGVVFGPVQLAPRTVHVKAGAHHVERIPIEGKAPEEKRISESDAHRLDRLFDGVRGKLFNCIKGYYGQRHGVYHYRIRIGVHHGHLQAEYLYPPKPPVSVDRCFWEHLDAIDIGYVNEDFFQVHELKYEVGQDAR